MKKQRVCNLPSQQAGSTLIIVMILLVAITVIGTIAVRQGLVSLNIATNSQAQQLLLQNSDAAFFNVEQEDNIIKSLSTSGMFGYIDGANNKDKELVFCFRGDQADFLILVVPVLWNGMHRILNRKMIVWEQMVIVMHNLKQSIFLLAVVRQP